MSTLKHEITISILGEVKKRLPAPPPPTPTAPVASSSQGQLFGMPAITPTAQISSNSAPDLATRHILWTKITSAGVSLPLPLDTCCSVSLVSQTHAELVNRIRPDLSFTKLEQHVPVSVAGPSSDLRAVGTMQVPIVWENGHLTTFTMLVVPNLAWPILFGQNHLRMTDAQIQSKALKVYFAAPGMAFGITCHDANPLLAFPSHAQGGTRTPQGSVANVTCLLTPLPSQAAHFSGQRSLSLSRGLNIVTVCLFVASSLLRTPLLSGSLWLEGNKFSPGLQTLSGPIDFSSIKHSSCLEPSQHPFRNTPHKFHIPRLAQVVLSPQRRILVPHFWLLQGKAAKIPHLSVSISPTFLFTRSKVPPNCLTMYR